MTRRGLDDRHGHVLTVPPAVLLAGAYTAGISAGFGAPASPWAAALLALVALAILAARARRPTALLFLALVGLASGAASATLHAPAASDLARRVGADRRRLLVIEGVVVEAPERRPDGARLLLDLVGARSATAAADGLVPVSGRARLHLPSSTERAEASCEARGRHSAEGEGDLGCGRPGDRVRLLAKLWPPERGGRSLGATTMPDLVDRGVALVGAATSGADCVVLEPRAGGGLVVLAERGRDAIHRAIDRHLAPDVAPVVRAFATGDRSGITRAVTDDFAASGLAHLLAVSGLNLAIVAGLFLVAAERVFRRVPRIALGLGARPFAALFALPFVALYTLLVGASPSAVRAAVMVALLLLAHLLRRAREAWAALAVAVTLMLAWDPTTLRDPSFQLSFAAVASLLALYPPLRARLAPNLGARPTWQRWAIEVTLASTAATLGTAPIVAWHFQRLSLVGVVANVPAHPLSSLVLVPLALVGGVLGGLGEVGGAIGSVSDAIAHPVLWIAGEGARLLVLLARVSASLPAASLRVPAPTGPEALLYYAGLGALLLVPRARLGRKIALACAAAMALEVGGLEVARAASTELRVAFLPVGQGDAAIVELPHGRVMLVDAGPPGQGGNDGAAERVILPWLRARRIRTIDRVVITHPHADHVGGLAAIAREVAIREVWWNGDLREGPPELEALLGRLGAKIVVGDRVEVMDGVTLSVLGPLRAASGYAGVNDGSVVLHLAYGERALLLTGDAEVEAEAELVDRWGDALRADVLKAGHHGSKTSSSELFLETVRPRHVVLSLGRDNHFGFPHRPVSERLDALGAEVWRTDLGGEIDVATDGHDLRVSRWVP